jgi:hypothetical protein
VEEEIKSLFFNILYLWTIAFVSPLVISYQDFFFFFYFYFLLFLLVRWLLLYSPCVPRAFYIFTDIPIT